MKSEKLELVNRQRMIEEARLALTLNRGLARTRWMIHQVYLTTEQYRSKVLVHGADEGMEHEATVPRRDMQQL